MRSKRMHKYNLSTLLMMMVFPLFSLANNKVDALFKEGNAQYGKGKYETAINLYQHVLDSGYVSAAVYFNLGNANYKLGNMPDAILNFEKARKLAPGDEDINLNLQLANLKITDKIDAVPEFFLSKWWNSCLMLFPTSTLSVLTVVLFIAGFLALIGYLFTVQLFLKKASFYTGVLLIGLGLISMLMAGMQDSYFKNHQHAIVFAGTVHVKSGPSEGQKTLFMIHEGTKVSIQEQSPDWLRIELPNGNSGWIKSVDVKEI